MGSVPCFGTTMRGAINFTKMVSKSITVQSGLILIQEITIKNSVSSPIRGFIRRNIYQPANRSGISGVMSGNERKKRESSGTACRRHSSVATAAENITDEGRVMSNTSQGKDFSKIPGPKRWPVFGNLLMYKLFPYSILSYHDALMDLHKKYGPITRQYIGKQVWVHLFDPEDVKTVYLQEGKMPYVPPLQETTQLYRKRKNMSLGLGNTNGEEWYRLRNAVQKIMLRPKDVQHYLPLVQEVASDFVKKIAKMTNSDGEVPCLKHEVAKWSLESAGMVCFERRLGSLSGGETETLAQKMVTANENIFYLSGLLKFSLPIYVYINTIKWNKLVQNENFFYSAAQKFLDDTIIKLQDAVRDGSLRNDQYSFLSYLMSHTDLNRSDIYIITLSLFGDGLSTTTPAMLYNLYCLAKNQDAQEKVYQELISVVPHNEPITVEVLNKLTYLKAAVKETFRLFPIGTEVSRILQKDLLLAGYQIPAGTHVDFNMLVHFRSEAYFQDPLKYMPERWLRDKEASGVHPYLVNPFGHGTRMCAGRRFAEQDLYLVLSCILRHFRLEYPAGEEIKQMYNTLLFPDRQLKVRFKPRK